MNTLSQFLYDVSVYGYDNSVLKTITGRPLLNSPGTVILVNAATVGSMISLVHGELTFRMKIPAAPTAGDVRSWGLYQQSFFSSTKNGAIYFDITDTAFTVNVVNAAGVATSKTITWDSGWTNITSTWVIKWQATGVEFMINGVTIAKVKQAGFDVSAQPPSFPLSPFVKNGNADNMDWSLFWLRNCEQLFVPEPREAYDIYESVSATVGAVTDSNAKTVHSIFATPMKRVSILVTAATTIKLNSASNNGILLNANEEYTTPAGMVISNVFYTTAGATTIRFANFR